MGIKIKPLPWDKYGEAKGAYAKYTIYEAGNGVWNCVCYPYEDIHHRLAEGVSISEAQDAAYRHHSASVLASIEEE